VSEFAVSQRFRLAYSWQLAATLVRRHPSLTIREMHPGGGQYDCLTLISDDGERLIDINRARRIHVHRGDAEPLPLELLFSRPEPFDLVQQLEDAAGLPRVSGPAPATPKSLTYRVAAHVITASVLWRAPIDVRSEQMDSSGPAGSGTRDLLASFPLALERARSWAGEQAGDAAPWARFWLVLHGGAPLAALDEDGHLYTGDQQVLLQDAYAEHGRSVTRSLAAVAPSLLT
jgi:hypothetical protein